MFFPYWTLVLVPMLMLPVFTNLWYQQAYLNQKNQISADNAAILLAQGDLRIVDLLDKGSRSIRKLDSVHHIWHLCKLNPATAAKCLAMDRVWESAIRAKALSLKWQVKIDWANTVAQTEKELQRLGAETYSFIGIHSPELRPLVCPKCGLVYGYRLTKMPEHVVSVGKSFLKSASVNLIKTKFNGGSSYEMH